MPGWDVIRDEPVYMCEREGGGRGECGFSLTEEQDISVVIHTFVVYYESIKRELR
jgi:hypothetical protein